MVLAQVSQECGSILAAGGEDIRRAVWNTAGWLERALQNAPQAFDGAFNRWRELYADQDLEEQVRKYSDVFGLGVSAEGAQ